MLAAWFLGGADARLSLNPVDLIIIVVYFAWCWALGLLPEAFTNTGEEFFMAGREMTAWIAGLSFHLSQPGCPGDDGIRRGDLPIRHSG